ncbi:phosphotransferase, partial [Yersinia enterocolitica]
SEQILEEHQFSLDLAESEIPVIAPLQLDGRTLHTHGGFFFTVFPSVGGRQYEIDNLDQLEWVGRYLGRIHQVGSDALFVARSTIGIEEYLTEPRQLLASSELVPAKQRDKFLAATDL